MGEAIGIRLEEDFLKKIEIVSKEEVSDRSSVIRKLLHIGYKNFIISKAADKYREGKFTLSEAANQAEITLWEMETYLVEHGFKSEYSQEDLNEELSLLIPS